MTIEYLPNGIACDLSCKYCYQDPMRKAGNISAPLSFVRVKDTLKKYGAEFSVFGGEALLTPKPKLEEIFQFGLETYGHNSLQTNALRMDDDHIAMFKKYKVGVGISIDGWGELNAPRSCRDDTVKILNNIKKLVSNGIIPSLIITIHRANAKPELVDFIRWTMSHGIYSINLHILETDSEEVRRDLQLTDKENYEIFSLLYDSFRDDPLYLSPFNDIKELLTKTKPNVNCVWNACDAVNTQAVQGVGPDGSLINCGRTNKDGVNWVKTDASSKERYLALYNTPFADGGCKDCKYFFACKGQCPGTAIDGDWRNKTSHCQFWYSMIGHIWRDLAVMEVPVFSEARMQEMGGEFINTIAMGHASNSHTDIPHGDKHGDHTDNYGSREVPAVWID